MRVSGIVDFYSPSLPTVYLRSIDSTWKRIASLKRSFGVEHFSIQLHRSKLSRGPARSETWRIVFRRARYRVDRITFTFRQYVNEHSKNISFESFLVKSFFFSFVTAQIAFKCTKERTFKRESFSQMQGVIYILDANIHSSSMQSSIYFTLKWNNEKRLERK